eukprot:407572-Prymnesium_polylepis.1
MSRAVVPVELCVLIGLIAYMKTSDLIDGFRNKLAGRFGTGCGFIRNGLANQFGTGCGLSRNGVA